MYQFLTQKDFLEGEDNTVLIKSAGKKIRQFAPLLFKHLREVDQVEEQDIINSFVGPENFSKIFMSTKI
jgi:hypothetical protein